MTTLQTTDRPLEIDRGGWQWFGRDEVVREGTAALSRCVGDVDSFLAAHWARAPLLTDNGQASYEDLLSLDAIDELLTERQVRLPSLRLVRDGIPLNSDGLVRSTRLGQSSISDVVDPARVLSEVQAGATLVLQGLQHWWPPLQRLCSAISARLSHRVQANAYVTPAHSAGLARHYDTHDVLMLQVAGAKEWRVEPSAFQAPLSHQTWSEVGGGTPIPESEPLLSLTLSDGQCLYLPRGFVHSGATQQGVSAHITIGLNSTTWESAARQSIGEQASQSVELRSALPPGFASGSCYVNPGKEVPASLDTAQTLLSAEESFWQTFRRPGRGRFSNWAGSETVSEVASFRRSPDVVVRGQERGERYVLRVEDRQIDAPAYVRAAIERLLQGPPVRAVDLEGQQLGAASSLVLIGRFIAEGLIEPV